jgi:hypothetical protein
VRPSETLDDAEHDRSAARREDDCFTFSQELYIPPAANLIEFVVEGQRVEDIRRPTSSSEPTVLLLSETPFVVATQVRPALATTTISTFVRSPGAERRHLGGSTLRGSDWPAPECWTLPIDIVAARSDGDVLSVSVYDAFRIWHFRDP